MKKSEIASLVFSKIDRLPLHPLDKPCSLKLADFPALALLPWWCEICVQWAVRMTSSGEALKKKMLPKVNQVFIAETDGALLAGIPGDGIDAPLWALTPLGDALAKSCKPGMTLELACANLGVVNRDWQVKGESQTTHGNQRYRGRIEADGTWQIVEASLQLKHADLEQAISIAKMVLSKGPFTVRSRDEAAAIVEIWIKSAEGNVNPDYVKTVLKLAGDRFNFSQEQDNRRLCGLGLGYFRHRFDKGPFTWNRELPPGYAALCPPEKVEQVLAACLG
jgi:hypothetical protein